MGIRQFFERFQQKPTREWFAAKTICGDRNAGDDTDYRFAPADG